MSNNRETTPVTSATISYEVLKKIRNVLAEAIDIRAKAPDVDAPSYEDFTDWQNSACDMHDLLDQTLEHKLIAVSESTEAVKTEQKFSFDQSTGLMGFETESVTRNASLDAGYIASLEGQHKRDLERIAELENRMKLETDYADECREKLEDAKEKITELTAENERLKSTDASGFGIQLRRMNDDWDAAYRDLEAKLKLATDALETLETEADDWHLRGIARETLAKLRGE